MTMTISIKRVLCAAALCSVVQVVPAMVALDDSELGEVHGQALLVADFIGANSLAGAGGSGSATDFEFYRMGLDVLVEMNMNIDKLQLGCGGFNESIASNACDIDLDFVSLMGLNATGDGPGSAKSSFRLERPYIEIAIRGSGANREIAGFKVGSQAANGYFGTGRVYNNGQANLENGGTCNSNNSTNRLACHSGLNRVSGFLGVELSGQFPVSITLLGTQTACFGDHATNSSCNTPYYVDIAGTRISEIVQPGVPLTLSGGFLSAIGISQAYATIQQNLRFIHGFALDGTSDFFLSFQRERVAYPTYAKDGYSHPANAGWWMNVPEVNVKNFTGDTVSLGFGEAFNALSAPGPLVVNSELNTVPPVNCYGSYRFC